MNEMQLRYDTSQPEAEPIAQQMLSVQGVLQDQIGDAPLSSDALGFPEPIAAYGGGALEASLHGQLPAGSAIPVSVELQGSLGQPQRACNSPGVPKAEPGWVDIVLLKRFKPRPASTAYQEAEDTSPYMEPPLNKHRFSGKSLNWGKLRPRTQACFRCGGTRVGRFCLRCGTEYCSACDQPMGAGKCVNSSCNESNAERCVDCQETVCSCTAD